MPELFDPYLVRTFKKDKRLLEESKIPTVTVSASYKEDLKRIHGYPDDDTLPDVVFSRAHFSMAAGVAVEAWGKKVDPTKMWVVDPTNYVSKDDWSSISFTETVGKTLARRPLLKHLKDLVDKFGRSKLPILKSITPPLLHLTENIKYPILSFHIAAGNILAQQGKRVVQVITDPHVREEYAYNADKKNIIFCVFDDQTKLEFLETAALLGKEADPDRVFVTGPPIDPRIMACKKKKTPWRSGCLNLCLTTGGLGTNKTEILDLVEQFVTKLSDKSCKIRLIVYAGTHKDIYDEVLKTAELNKLHIDPLENTEGRLRIIYHPQIVDANEELIKYAFPWAHGFITKPSGDMAYDAVTSGSFLLTLAEWGEWEERIREIFEQKDISRKALTEDIVAQLDLLTKSKGRSQSWIEKAMNNAQSLEPLFYQGAKNIVKTVHQFK